MRTPCVDNRRAHGLFRRRSHRNRRMSCIHPPTDKGRRRLHKNHRYRRQHPFIIPTPSRIQPRRTEIRHRRSPQIRKVDSYPQHIDERRHKLPRRQRRHDHPLRIQRTRRYRQLPHRHRRTHRRTRRIRQPDSPRRPLQDLVINAKRTSIWYLRSKNPSNSKPQNENSKPASTRTVE